MDIELVKQSLARLRERRAAIPAMRDYKPQKSGVKKTTAPVQTAFDLTSFVGKLQSKLSSTPAEDEKKGGEI